MQENNSKKKRFDSSESRVIHILLPFCVDFEHDIFFNVLKNVVGRVGRAKLVDHCLDNGFKLGMIAGEIRIDENDIFPTWCNSKKSVFRQSQLLGYWAMENSPTFAKVLLGGSHESRGDSVVELASRSRSKTMTGAEVDAIIFQKMKCQLIELNVCESTLTNLKHFVTVPYDAIGVDNEVLKLPTRMKSFAVKEEYFGKCWAALKHCTWNVNEPQQMHHSLAWSMSCTTNPSRTGTEHDHKTKTNTIPIDLTKDSLFGNATHSSDDIPMDLSFTTGNTFPLKSEKHDHYIDCQLASEVRKSNVTFRQEFEILRCELHRQLTAEFDKVNQTLRTYRDSDELQIQLNEKLASIAEMEKANRTLELQSAEKIGLLAESEKVAAALQHELDQKNGSFIELQSDLNRAKVALNECLTEKEDSNRAKADLQIRSKELEMQLNEKCASFAEMVKTNHTLTLQTAQLNRANADLQIRSQELEIQLTEVQEANNNRQLHSSEQSTSMEEFVKSATDLQQELVQKNDSLVELQSELNRAKQRITELEQACEALKLELCGKNEVVNDMKNLKFEIQRSISDLESEIGRLNRANGDLQLRSNELKIQLNEKCNSLAEMEKTNHTLQLLSSDQSAQLAASRKLASDLQQKLVQKDGSFIKLQSALYLNQLAMNESLNLAKDDLQICSNESEMQCKQKCTSFADMLESNHTQQVQSDEQSVLSIQHQNSIVTLHSQLDPTNVTVNDQTSNRADLMQSQNCSSRGIIQETSNETPVASKKPIRTRRNTRRSSKN